MMSKSLVQLHWDYFLLMEKDLIEISETLELDKANFAAFGPRILQLILAAGSELDVALKSFASIVAPESSANMSERPNMSDFKTMIAENALEQFATATVKILRSDILLSPWACISEHPEKSIPWWDAYNKVKHKRTSNYSKATLEVGLNLVAALFTVDAYLAEASLERVPGFTQIIDWGHHRRMPQLEEYYATKL